MYLSPGRSWLTGAALSGVLLMGSMISPAIGMTMENAQPMTQPIVHASQQKNTSIPEFLNQKLHWVSVDTKKKVDIAAQKQQQANKDQAVADSTAKSKKSLQVAQAGSANGSSAKQPISRGDSNSSTLISRALSLQGIPYVFGGTTRSGFDCSGFTKYVFSGSGINLARTSYEQYASGTKVSKDQLQPGDLVFFSTYSQGASHVGIYIGNGRFIHAGSNGVGITSLNDSYYASRYLGARRY